MLAVVDKPLIQYAVEEAVAAGMTDLIFVTGRHKRAIEDHFDASPELEAELEAKGKLQLLAVVHSETPDLFSDDAQCAVVAPVLYEAVWWQGELQRYTQADRQGQWSHDYWRDRDAACDGQEARAAPDTLPLQQQAASWWQRLGEPVRP